MPRLQNQNIPRKDGSESKDTAQTKSTCRVWQSRGSSARLGHKAGVGSEAGQASGESPWATRSSPSSEQTHPELQGETRPDQCPGLMAGWVQDEG